MASRYWVGGTASWDGTAGTKWSTTSGGAGGASVPTTADDVFFTNLSTGTCTVASGNTGAKSITCTGFTGTLSVTVNLTVAGSITFVAGMTYTQSTGTVTVSVTGASTITSAGKSFHRLEINAPAATVQLADALSCGSFGTLTVTAGTFTTNNFNITAYVFNSNNSNTRTINLGSSTCTMSISGTGDIAWNTATVTGLTLNAGTSTIDCTGNNAIIALGSTTTYNNITFSGSASTTITLYNLGGTISGTLTLTAPASAGITTVQFDGSITIGTLVASGASAVRRLFFSSFDFNTARTLTVTTWSTISDIDFQDITMNTSRSGTRLGNRGNNTNITFPAAKTVYWNLAGAQNWSATGWATSSGGAPAVNNFPLAQDTAVFNNAGSMTGNITIEANWGVGTLDSSARTSAGTIVVSSNYDILGNLLLGTGITFNGSAIQYFSGRSTTQTITTNGVTINPRIYIRAVSGTVRQLDAITSSASITALTIQYGTYDTNNFNFTSASNISLGIFTKTLTFGSSTITLTGSGTMFSGVATNTTITANTATITLTSASAKTFAGGNINYNGLTINQGGAGALTITGSNTFGNITNTYSSTGATSILFTAATTSTFSNWNASGTSGKLLTIGSVTAASHTLSKSSGTVSANYLSISRSTATGGATWYAGANSTDGGNNSGWIFSNVPSGSGNFMLFF